MPKPYVIYLYPATSTFIKKDIAILEERFAVKLANHNWVNKRLLPLSLLKQFVFLLLYAPKGKAIFVMFGGWWSVLPSILGKLLNTPVYIILGGTDCVSYPSINYGHLRKPLLKKVLHLSYQFATKLLPVDDSLMLSENLYFESAVNKKQGIKHFFPKLNTPHTTIYNGFDAATFKVNAIKKANTFITIAGVADKRRFTLKGIEQILLLAPFFANCKFTVIGVSQAFQDTLKSVPPNVELHPFLQATEFISIVSGSSFYLQLSLSEGFPNALCEAMLCECVPVVSAVGAMPFIVKNTGFVLPSSNIESSVAHLKDILNTEPKIISEKGKKARENIIKRFDISIRREQLLSLVK